MKEIGPGGKVPIRAPKSATGSRLAEIRMVMMMGEIEKKVKNKSVAWRVSRGGEANRVVRRQ